MRQLTLRDYLNIHGEYRGIWTTERWDLPDWASIRDKYMGRLTMTNLEGGRTTLLIEGLHFDIIDRDGISVKADPWMNLVGLQGFIDRLTSGELTDAQMASVLALMKARHYAFYYGGSKQNGSPTDSLSNGKPAVIDIIRTALLALDNPAEPSDNTTLQTFRNKHYNPKESYECTVLIFCQAESRPSEDWLPANAEDINCDYLYTRNGIRYYGRL